jgi:hypothetical protein
MKFPQKISLLFSNKTYVNFFLCFLLLIEVKL